jgi:pimeloyl-ACP methyl ester carboxylesterase
MPDAGVDFDIHTGLGVRLSGERHGSGVPIVLLHGLTATRRYVVMGSRALERSGHRTIAYDARGHGHSSPAPSPDAYTYELLVEDLRAVLDELQIERAAIAGASMGAHTAIRLALSYPERVAGLGLITPAYDPDTPLTAAALADWDRLARGLREGGVEGFVDAYDLASIPLDWRGTVEKVLRQRLSAHQHPPAVADAMQGIPRSRPFESWQELGRIEVPTVVVGSRDEADPTHPLATAERYATTIPAGSLVVEDAGPPARSPIAWQGGQLSRVLAEMSELARW